MFQPRTRMGRLRYIWGSREGHAEVVGMLIERGADLSAQGEYEDTPLHRSMPAGLWVLIDMSGAGAI